MAADSSKPWQRATAFSDGASRGNPGPAGAGGVLVDAATGEKVEIGRYLGTQTNNVAEYEALIIVLQAALKRGVEELVVCADSELLVRQLNGIYRVKTPHIVPLFTRAQKLLKSFRKSEVRHVRRELNKEADRMSNRAIDENMNDDA